jgi:hypothetical protein
VLELQDSVSTLRHLAKRAVGRQSMREKRDVDATACPDWRTDPEGWRSWQSQKLNRGAKT